LVRDAAPMSVVLPRFLRRRSSSRFASASAFVRYALRTLPPLPRWTVTSTPHRFHVRSPLGAGPWSTTPSLVIGYVFAVMRRSYNGPPASFRGPLTSHSCSVYAFIVAF